MQIKHSKLENQAQPLLSCFKSVGGGIAPSTKSSNLHADLQEQALVSQTPFVGIRADSAKWDYRKKRDNVEQHPNKQDQLRESSNPTCNVRSVLELFL
eukprot:4554641-Amphidinium_carterae.1